MSDRSRFRRGRAIHYNPTTAEAATYGTDQWIGVITDVNADGTVDLLVDPPDADVIPVAASAPSVGYVQAEAVTTANLANALRTAVLNYRKNSVTRGPLAGQFELAPVEN